MSRASELLIEVNPCHLRFYEANFGFEWFGELTINREALAPGQPMRIEMAKIAQRYPAGAA